jgi:DNA-binding beta-propeller fold protein YncE
VTEGCEPLPHDAGADARLDAPFDAGIDANMDASALIDAGPGADAGRGCWLPVACDAGACDPASATLGLTRLGAIESVEAPALESVDFIPGTEDRAVAMSAEHLLAEVYYDGDGLRFGRIRTIPVESALGFTTSVKVHPSGRFAAISIADADCADGEVVLVDVQDDFGVVLNRLTVGYGPDNIVFSEDGRWLVTADEDGRENRPCKPSSRFGGSVSFVDVGDDPATARVARTVPIAHAMDSEPESVAVAADGTVVVTLQETSELAVLSTDASVATRVITLPAGSAPDGAAIATELGVAVVALEHTDDVITVSLGTGGILHTIDLVSSGHVPPEYNRDTGDPVEVHEPEQVVLLHHRGARFAVIPLQESHAALAYRLEDDGTLVFDSIAPVGVDYLAEASGRGRSRIGPEGIAARPDVGLFLVGAEREGSLTLLRSAASMYAECP